MLVIVVLCMCLLSGCAIDSVPDADDSRLHIVCTTFPQYDWVRNLIQGNEENILLTLLMDKGGDLHNFQPSALDIARVSDCDMFVYVGGESDVWVDDALAEAVNPDMRVINMMEVVSGNLVEEEHLESFDHMGQEGHGHEGHASEYDEHIWLSLRNAGMIVEEVSVQLEALDGAAGLRLALEQDPDLILLDLMLPKMDGFQVCQTLREQGRATPIIMLTAREEEKDKVLGLELGADDYITKPFSMRELLARVKSNIRRTEMLTGAAPQGSANRLELGRVQVDLDAMLVYKDGEALDLTQREYELVKTLASSRGQAVSRESLMEQVWNYDGYVGDVRAVDVAIRRLREKLEDDPAAPEFIVTRRGLGYAFGV